MHSTRLFLAAASAVLAATTISIADDAPEVVRYQLENGLEVVLAPDRRIPKVGLTLIYRVGGMNEPAGRSGFAHLFEHLMFSGTAKYPDFDATLGALGASNNAFTEEDRTIYLAEGLSSALPVLLSIEADRMANLGREVDQGELDLERNVVKNEMRQRILDSAGQAGVEALRAGLFPEPHPYGEAVIGSIADLDAAQLGDVKAFFNRYYVPNNAILALAGDFDIEATKGLIADTFGRVPRGADVALPEPAAPGLAALRLETTDRLPSPMVMMAVAGPSVDSEGSRALTVAADVLGNFEYGVLRRRLVNTGLAVQAMAGWEAGRLGGRFAVSATAAPGVAPEVLEAELRNVLADFAAEPMRAEDVDRARRNILLNRRLGVEPTLGKASALAVSLDLFGDTALALADDPLIVGLTPEVVAATYRDIVKPERLSVLTIRPGEPGDYPAVLKESSGTPQPIVVAERPAVDVPLLPPSEAGYVTLPQMEEATLGNGIRLVHYKSPGSPRALIAATVSGGWTSDRPGQEGLTQVTVSLMGRGSGERDFEAFSKATKDIGADIFGQTDPQRTALLLSVAAEELGAGAKLLADAIAAPRFDPAEWTALKAEYQQGLMYRQMDPTSLAYFKLEELVFPVPSGLPALQPTVASIDGLIIDDIRAAHGQLFTPKAMTLYSVGPLEIEEVRRALDTALGSWSGAGNGVASVPHPAAVFADGRKVVVVPSIGSSQAVIYLARPAPTFDEPDALEAVTVARLLGSDTNSRLNTILRTQKGYSYGVSASVMNSMRVGGALVVSAQVQADKVGAALDDIFKGFDSLVAEPVTEAELQRTVMAATASSAGTVETSAGLFGLVTAAASLDMTAAEYNRRLEAFLTLDLGKVREIAQSLASLDRAIVVIAGDPQSVLPQLAEIGITEVEVLPPPAL